LSLQVLQLNWDVQVTRNFIEIFISLEMIIHALTIGLTIETYSGVFIWAHISPISSTHMCSCCPFLTTNHAIRWTCLIQLRISSDTYIWVVCGVVWCGVVWLREHTHTHTHPKKNQKYSVSKVIGHRAQNKLSIPSAIGIIIWVVGCRHIWPFKEH
jgi:hypothetical protein